jgi:acetamidase/formamidase
VKKGSGNHLFTGPVYVRDAVVGDVLEVRIHDVRLRQNWGWNVFRGYMGTVPEDFPYTRLIHVPLDRTANVAMMPSGFNTQRHSANMAAIRS